MPVSSLPATCFTCCPVSPGQSVCLFAAGSLYALGLPFFVYSSFVCVFVLCFMYLHDCLFSCVDPRPCLLSVSVFFSLFLSGWLSGHQAFNPSSLHSALLLCSVVPLTSVSLPLLFFFTPSTWLCVPTSKQYPLNVTGNTQWKKGRDLGNFRRRQLLLWWHNFWICCGERGMNRGVERGRENVWG